MSKDLVNYDAQFAESAAAYAKQAAVQTASFFSTHSGVLKYGKQAMPGNQICTVILDNIRENVYYEGSYSAEQASAPKCYAFGRALGDMEPHPSMAVDTYFSKQSDTCMGCPMNVFGTADRGKGKACKNIRRLALLNAGNYVQNGREYDLDLFDEDGYYRTAQLAFIKVSVTSARNWDVYVDTIAKQYKRPPHGVITRLSYVPDPKYLHVMRFELVELLDNKHVADIIARHNDVVQSQVMMQGYSAPRQA